LTAVVVSSIDIPQVNSVVFRSEDRILLTMRSIGGKRCNHSLN